MRAFIIGFVLAGLVAGCGFHLRGKVPLSDTMSVIAVESSDTALRAEMVEALESAGASVVRDAAAAKSVLKLHDIEFERRVRSIDTRGKVNGFTLIYRVKYTVTGPNGDDLRKSVPLRLERDFNFDSTQVLQKETEELELRDDMVKELARRIIRQLSTIAARTDSLRFTKNGLRTPASVSA